MNPYCETSQSILYHADCLEVMPWLIEQGEKFDCIIADLPYGTTQCAWDSVIPFEPLWECYKALIKPNRAIVLFASQPFTSALVMSNPKYFKHEWVWEKDKISGFLDAKIKPLKAHESILIFSEALPQYNPIKEDVGRIANKHGKASRLSDSYGSFKKILQRESTERFPRTVLKFNTVKHNTDGCFHPTQKPLLLLSYLVKTYTNVGDRILDNTAGSFTTGIAAIQTGRYCVGIEREEKYCQISAKRMTEAQQEVDSMLIKPWEIEANTVVASHDQTSLFGSESEAAS